MDDGQPLRDPLAPTFPSRRGTFSGHFLDCLTPGVLPSLRTLSLEGFDISLEPCMAQITAALREGALRHVEVRGSPCSCTCLGPEVTTCGVFCVCVCVCVSSAQQHLSLFDIRDEEAQASLLLAVARAHGCPNVHTL